MNPNDPNDPNNQAGQPSNISLDDLYGPSTPGTDPTLPQTPLDPAGAVPPLDQAGLAPPQDLPPQNLDLASQYPPDTIQSPYDNQQPTTDYALPPTDATDDQFYQDAQQEPAPYGAPQDELPVEPEQDPAQMYSAPAIDRTPGVSPDTILPPIPKRSKLPFIVIGAILALLVIVGAGAFVFSRFSGGGSTDNPPTPTASEEPISCEDDPDDPDCVEPEPSEEPFESPIESSIPTTSVPPETCKLLDAC